MQNATATVTMQKVPTDQTVLTFPRKPKRKKLLLNVHGGE